MNAVLLLLNFLFLQTAKENYSPESPADTTDYTVVIVLVVMVVVGTILFALVVGLILISRRKRNEPQSLFTEPVKLEPEPARPNRVPSGQVVVPPPATTPQKTPAIFISYRREDSSDVTGRIYDRLCQHFGKENVFKDVDSIPLGVDFRKHLGNSVGQCNVLLTIIGRQWIAGEKGKRRLDDARDFVRIEMEAALKRDIPVVPVLVQGSSIPAAEELPELLQSLAYRNGIPVRPDPDFHQDMDRLIKGIEGHLRGR